MRTQINQNFLKSLPIVAGCLGNKLGVRVVLSNVAKTDGDTIYIPAEIDHKSVSIIKCRLSSILPTLVYISREKKVDGPKATTGEHFLCKNFG